MAGGEDQAIIDLENYKAAAEVLQVELARVIAGNRQAVKELRAGRSFADPSLLAGSAEWSRDMTKALEAFEAARRDVRSSLATALRTDGATLATVADVFGVTRQRAIVFVAEGRERGL